MLAYIKGTLEIKSNNYVVIDVGGLGYKVYMSETSINALPEVGTKVKVHTHYQVREDDISIFGFNTNEELRMFTLLISVSGVGAKSAINMLSNISPSEFALAIINNDTSKLVKIPGIGAKTAARIVLELKDKLNKEETINSESTTIKEKVKEAEQLQEAIAALQVLGYQRKEIEKAFEKINTEGLAVEDLIRKGLATLGM